MKRVIGLIGTAIAFMLSLACMLACAWLVKALIVALVG